MRKDQPLNSSLKKIFLVSKKKEIMGKKYWGAPPHASSKIINFGAPRPPQGGPPQGGPPLGQPTALVTGDIEKKVNFLSFRFKK